MSNCFSSFPASPFPNSNYYFAPTPTPPTRTSIPNMHASMPTMSGAMPSMSAHSFSHNEPDGYFVHHHHPASFHHAPRGSTYFVNPNSVYAEEPPHFVYYPPNNVAQYLHYQRMQHLNRAQFLHNQNVNNLIANIYAYRRSQAYAAANNEREQSNYNNGSKESEPGNANNVIITEVTDDEDDYEINGKKCIDKKDYVDAISIDGDETLV